MHFLRASVRNKLLLITGTGTTLVLLAALFGFWASQQGLAGIGQLLQQGSQLQGQDTQALAAIGQVMENTQQKMRLAMLLMGIAVLIAFVSFLYYVQQHIVLPARQLSAILGQMAKRNFNQSLPKLGEDELGQIASSGETIRNAMQAIITELEQSSNQLTASASQLQEVIAITRQGVEQQLSETEQVAAAIHQMTTTMHDMVEQAQQAAQSAAEADQDAGKGRRVVARTIDDIEALSSEMEQASLTVAGLQQRSVEIGSVLDVIKGISQQTNLLALNAAIEAARAGEQGRGFAVVADEVRALATRTQKATEEVEAMIAQLQDGAEKAVQVIVQSREHAQAGAGQSAEAGSSLEAITAAVDRISQMNAHISDAAIQQQHMAEEINRNIMNISEIAEHSAEGSKRIDEAQGQLNGLSSRLSALVASFHRS
ncbi:MAG: hypothetical protein K0A95_05535 [Chromatiales bacterium]|nr:hypothetical protein [Gammaproteobacteria bacterium]MBW6476518.1 hypothetical protein [Chromatiales bacterium]